MSYEKRYAGIGGILDRLIWSVGRIVLVILFERPVEKIGVSIDWVLLVMREEGKERLLLEMGVGIQLLSKVGKT